MQILGHLTQALLLSPFIAGAVMALMPNPEYRKQR